jgi:hypothetical protein
MTDDYKQKFSFRYPVISGMFTGVAVVFAVVPIVLLLEQWVKLWVWLGSLL